MGSSAQASGGRNHDNESINNSSRDNVNANKYDTGMQYVARTSNTMQSDGSMQKVLPSGNIVSVGGAGTTSSTGEVRFESSEAANTNLQQSVSDQRVLAEGEFRSYADSKATTISKAANYLTQIAEHTRTSEGYNIDTSTEEGKAINKALESMDNISKNNDYTTQQSAEAYIAGNTSFSTPLKGITGLGASGELGGKINATSGSQQLDSQHTEIATKTSGSESNQNLMRALSSDSFAEEHGLDKSLSTDVRQSNEQTQRLEQQVSARQESINTYNEAIDYNRTHGASISKDMYQDVLSAHQSNTGKSHADAKRDVENRTPAVMRTFNTLAQGETHNILQQVNDRKHAISGERGSQKLDEFTNRYSDKVDSNVNSSIENIAEKDGFDGRKIQQEISLKGDDLQTKYDTKYGQTDGKIDGTNADLKTQLERRQINIDKLEEDRIGTGKISSAVGGLGRQSKNSELPMPEFDEISRPYEPKAGVYNWETGEIDPLPQNQGERHTFKPESKVADGQHVERELLKPKKD